MTVTEKTESVYSIQEVGERLGLSPYTLRYYEKEGLIRDIRRLENGHRAYTEHDLSWIGFVSCLKETGMTLEQIKAFTNLPLVDDRGIHDRIRILREHRKQVVQRQAEIVSMLNRIDGKISWYQSQLEEEK